MWVTLPLHLLAQSTRAGFISLSFIQKHERNVACYIVYNKMYSTLLNSGVERFYVY